MARPQSKDFDKRKDGILAIAAQLFALRGFLGASVSDLAERCNTSKSLIYHYYPSKEDILYAVMSKHLDDLLAVAENDTGIDSPRLRLRTRTREFMRLYVDAADFQKVLLNDLDNLPASRRGDIVERQRKIIAVIDKDLNEITGNTDSGLPRTMLFFGMINWAHTWFKPNKGLSAEQFADLVVDTMLNGVDNNH